MNQKRSHRIAALLLALLIALLAVGAQGPRAFAAEPKGIAPIEAAARPTVAGSGASAAQASEAQGELYRIGVGKADITGPASGVGMMGYSMPQQRTAGLHTRLYARAFVVTSPTTGERVAFVSADQLAVFQAVHAEVLARLQARFGDRYTARNTLLSATHTHATPGGTSRFATYDLSILGFDPRGFETVVNGIVEAITQADASERLGRIRVSSGRLDGASINRSPEAYAQNPEAERAAHEDDLNREMTVLRFESEEGAPFGMVSFFGVHATSMGNDNRLISGDNKGYASQKFERAQDQGGFGAPGFVAAFASEASGDASPNIYGGTDGGGASDFESTAIAGEKQLAKARELFETEGTFLSGPIDARVIYAPLGAHAVAAPFADGQTRSTCPAGYGLSMIAGAEDGPGFGREGIRCADLPRALRPLFCRDACQAEKPVLLRAGAFQTAHFSPDVLPLQIIRLGDMALVGTTFEVTTMAARRIEAVVLDRLSGAGVARVLVSGPSNGYSSYLTTREEYAAQNYEGASTHFGPWTLDAVRQELATLAESLASGTPLDPGAPPDDLRTRVKVALDTDTPDAAPRGKRFGDVLEQPAPWLRAGETAKASFVGASLNRLPSAGTFLSVEKKEGESWRVVARDDDWSTKIHWKRALCWPTFRCSTVDIEWDVPADAEPGQYRLRLFGSQRPAGSAAPTDFEGATQAFEVLPSPAEPVA